jgi:hypothetical protein
VFLLQIFSWLSKFPVHFRFASIFSHNLAYFPFIFASDFCCFASMRNKQDLKFFFASKRTEIFASIEIFAFAAKMRGHPSGEGKNLLPEVDAVLVLKTVRIGRSTVHEFVDHVLVVEAEDPLADEEGLEAEAVQVQGQPLQLLPLQELTRVPAPGYKPLKSLPNENVNL